LDIVSAAVEFFCLFREFLELNGWPFSQFKGTRC
jgi:hypothetical protein